MQWLYEIVKGSPAIAGAIAGALGGIVTGLISGVISPHIQWGVEKKKQLHASRKEFFHMARAEVSKLTPEEFRTSSLYAQLRPHLSEGTLAAMRSESVIIVKMGRSSYVHTYAQNVLEDIAVLERKWGLA